MWLAAWTRKRKFQFRARSIACVEVALSSNRAANIREAGGIGREKLKLASPFPCCPLIRECKETENLDQKKKIKVKFTLFKLFELTTLQSQTLFQFQRQALHIKITVVASIMVRLNAILKLDVRVLRYFLMFESLKCPDENYELK